MEVERRLHVVAFMFLAVSAFQHAHSSDSAIERALGDADTVSIATGRSEPIRTAPAVASVITSAMIQNAGARSLDEILALVPGIHIGYSFDRYSPVYAVRGFSEAFNQNVLILLDGVPQSELFFGDRSFAVGKIPIDMIERVEVMRGPGSALYGADAFIAVVNIISKKKGTGDAAVVASAGTHETRDLRLLSSTTWGELDAVAGFQFSQSDGHRPSIDRDQQSVLDDMMMTSASLAPARAATDHKDWGFIASLASAHSDVSIRSFKTQTGMGIGFAGALDPYGNIQSSGYEGRYHVSYSAPGSYRFDGTIDYARTEITLDDVHFFPPGAFGVFPDGVIQNGELDETRKRVDLSFGYSGFNAHEIRVGAGAEWADIKVANESRNYVVMGGFLIPTGGLQDTTDNSNLRTRTRSRDLVFVYLQDEWRFLPDWVFTVGVRHDDYSDYGALTNPRAVLVWNARYDLAFKLLYGRGFRGPSLMESDSQSLPALQSNPDLKPERLTTTEFAVDYQIQTDWYARFNIYRHETDDQIRQMNTGGPEFTPINGLEQKGQGFELETRWRPTDADQVSAYYAYQDNTDETTQRDSGYTPHHRMALAYETQLVSWFFNTRVTYVGPRDRVQNDTRPRVDPYTRVDLMVRTGVAKHVEASAEIRNLFETDADEAGFGTSYPGHMPLPGRTFLGSIAARF